MTMYSDSKTGRQSDRPVRDIALRTTAGFVPALAPAQVGELSTLALAHIGDGVYELMMRTALGTSGVTAAHDLHRETVHRVNAPAQARAIEHVLPLLDADELGVYKRGRNAKVNSVPQHAEVAEYHAATGLETLFGWLWLQGRTERLTELFNRMTEVL